MALRTRVVDFVKEGHSHRATALHFRASVNFVNDMAILKREIGSLAPKPQGRRGHGKLSGVHEWVRAPLEATPGMALDEMVVAQRRDRGIKVHRASGGGLLHRLGLSHKKRHARERATAA